MTSNPHTQSSLSLLVSLFSVNFTHCDFGLKNDDGVWSGKNDHQNNTRKRVYGEAAPKLIVARARSVMHNQKVFFYQTHFFGVSEIAALEMGCFFFALSFVHRLIFVNLQILLVKRSAAPEICSLPQRGSSTTVVQPWPIVHQPNTRKLSKCLVMAWSKRRRLATGRCSPWVNTIRKLGALSRLHSDRQHGLPHDCR